MSPSAGRPRRARAVRGPARLRRAAASGRGRDRVMRGRPSAARGQPGRARTAPCRAAARSPGSSRPGPWRRADPCGAGGPVDAAACGGFDEPPGRRQREVRRKRRVPVVSGRMCAAQARGPGEGRGASRLVDRWHGPSRRQPEVRRERQVPVVSGRIWAAQARGLVKARGPSRLVDRRHGRVADGRACSSAV